MQLYKAEIFLGGSRNNSVVKTNLSAAEVLVLRSIHGADSVTGVEPFGKGKRHMGAEFERLASFYGPKRMTACFPGVQPQLPETLPEVGVSPDEPEKKIAGGRAPRARASATELEALGIGA